MSDARIGPGYLFPGIGYGGSCLPKDLIALDRWAKDRNLQTPVIAGATATNRWQVQTFIEGILQFYDGAVKGKTLALWGASYKPRTDDIRNAPALEVVDALLEAGASIKIYDPVAGPALARRYGDSARVASKMYEALEGAHGLVIATEWREFHNPDFRRMGELLKEKVVFDGRNLYERNAMEGYGFRYFSVGRPPV